MESVATNYPSGSNEMQFTTTLPSDPNYSQAGLGGGVGCYPYQTYGYPYYYNYWTVPSPRYSLVSLNDRVFKLDNVSGETWMLNLGIWEKIEDKGE